MKRIFAIMAATVLTQPAYGDEGDKIWVHSALSPSVNPDIAVDLLDGATEGCWTNLKEVREYAHGQLSEVGFQVVEQGEVSGAVLEITVTSSRESGRCYGRVQVVGLVSATPYGEGVFGLPVWGLAQRYGFVFTGRDNANILTLEAVRKAVNAIEANR